MDNGGKLISTQHVLTAAANVLFAAGILKPDAEPTAVMVCVAHMITAINRTQPRTPAQARDLDPELARKITLAI